MNDAFNALYQKHYKQVYYIAYAILRDHFLAQDAVQETFIKIVRRFDALEIVDIQEAWLNVISRNTAIDLYRKRMRNQECSYDHMEVSLGAVDGGMENSFDMADEYELLEGLKPEQRKALLLVYVYGMTYKQLAAIQKVSIGAVKTQIHRAKKKLQAMLHEMEPAY
ncbi:RNA polymerase sigma factor [Paenibacillus albus]|uniref:RNA polymerase sigma factor n=1 Tax=Paenibacillus albus TaxID=2495582 RepID=A0A3S9A9H1_9BACL|nr:RNA polymerase sigma factor [Paenibacillus albus]AZN42360.1 RNA polymerase sigma factor [Paenibacillus albus]